MPATYCDPTQRGHQTLARVTDMSVQTADPTLLRIQGEFLEMPGLHLTLPQASRLWHLEPNRCLSFLEKLVAAGFLCLTPRGGYMLTRNC
jgi:hypothetical protein